MTSDTVRVDFGEGVATVTLDRPERLNALNSAMGRDLLSALGEAAVRPDVRCVLLTGAGRGFCAGGDITEMAASVERGHPTAFFEAPLRSFHQVVLALCELPKPVVAAVNGVAAGAGMNLALACDIVHASEEAVFSQAFVKLGLVPDCGGTFILPRLIGGARAAELMFTGDPLTAPEALALGLVGRVWPAPRLMPEALALARRLAQGPTSAIAHAKALLRRSFRSGLQEALDLERLAQVDCGSTEDFPEGVRAFQARRAPLFRGR